LPPVFESNTLRHNNYGFGKTYRLAKNIRIATLSARLLHKRFEVLARNRENHGGVQLCGIYHHQRYRLSYVKNLAGGLLVLACGIGTDKSSVIINRRSPCFS